MNTPKKAGSPKPAPLERARATDFKRHRAQRMVDRAKARARRSGLACTIGVADLMPLPDVCPVLGFALEYGPGGGEDMARRATLDRLDNAAGYVPGNVVVISHRANLLKRDATPDELRRVADYAALADQV